MKIRDRLVLGALVGLLANLPKLAIGSFAINRKWSEIDGPMVAAGVFVPGHKLRSVFGRSVGYLADASIAGLLGLVTVYALSITGKDRPALKGVILGSGMWQLVYGFLSAFGASQIRPYSPKTVLSEFASHSVFGMTAALLATKLGDESLFTGKTALAASPTAVRDMSPALKTQTIADHPPRGGLRTARARVRGRLQQSPGRRPGGPPPVAGRLPPGQGDPEPRPAR
ncbi:MAG: hypothetical protein RDU89_10130 [bacterium]|nr:hypothetical protein [bacterium]